jgi:serine protease inhibitor
MEWPFTSRNPESADATSDESAALAEIRFAFRLFQELVDRDASTNIFFSPFSVMLCLAMVYDGAQGETRVGMARALELTGLDSAGVESAIAGLRSVIQKQEAGVQLLISNSLWCNEIIQVDPAFTARAREIYGAEVREIDFAAADAPARINAWVSEKTAAKIPRIIDHLSALTLLVSLNAIYFKGLWKQSFQRDWTRDRPFAAGSGKEKVLPRMLQRGRFRYFEQADFQAVVLPYQGARVAMYIFLPARTYSLRELHGLLSPSRWETWMKQFALTLGSVGLPRFKMGYAAELRPALTNLGMERAFDRERAEFGGIRKGPAAFWIDQVLHRAVADVNEEGTEATAATEFLSFGKSPKPAEPEFEVIVDRPFLFLIRDEASGNILFIGSVSDPDS